MAASRPSPYFNQRPSRDRKKLGQDEAAGDLLVSSDQRKDLVAPQVGAAFAMLNGTGDVQTVEAQLIEREEEKKKLNRKTMFDPDIRGASSELLGHY